MYGKFVTHESVVRLPTLNYFVNPAYYDIEGKEEAQAKYVAELFSGFWKLYFLLDKEREWLPELLAKKTLFIELDNLIWDAELIGNQAFYLAYVEVKIVAIVTEPLIEVIEKVLRIEEKYIDIYTMKELVYVVADATHLAIEKWDEDIKRHLSVHPRST